MTAAPRTLETETVSSNAGAGAGPAVISWMQAPFIALQFLTVVPPLVRRAPRPDDLGRSEAFFPAAGLALGGILALTDGLLAPFVAPLILNVVLVGMLAVLTGALHLDGVVDTADGLFAGANPQRRLAVMRDPRAGSYGVVTVVLLLALKLAALASLPQSLRAPALVLAPCFGRWGIVLATGTFAYARPEGMGRTFKESIRWRHVAIAGAIAVGAAMLAIGSGGIIIWMGVSAAVLLAGRWISGRLGGLTGDTYGALCETIEAGVLVAFSLQLGTMVG